MAERPYELVLLGATGYTGKFTAQYIQEHVHPDLSWAIAGRNEKRLLEIAEELKQMNPARIQPGMLLRLVVEVKSEDLSAIAGKTKVLMTTLGPYAKFGEPVVKACVDAGTHYLDVTGEVTFTYDMMRKYDKAAKAKGVCVLPSDILAYLCAKTAREKLNVGLRDCINSLQTLVGTFSGGTSHSVIGLVEAYPISFINASSKPTALCPIAPPKATPSTIGRWSSLVGSRHVSGLGRLTDSPQALSDTGIVYRSWGIFDAGAYYGPQFTFTKYMRVSNGLIGACVHYLFAIVLIGLYLRPVRSIFKRLSHSPGAGPDAEEAAKNILSYKAVATADEPRKRRVHATYHYEGSVYYMTGITLTEAALVLSRGGDCLGKRLGGMITPTTLEMEYVERLQRAGIKLGWGML
ncbi:uncharacterized protein BDZ99DRAFT_512369 [Mytilinidion resinicola]|uniref:Saccharopine dehydrogenase NADP binding domain-containing protein n=1 Tax=Mytilinidion resinicola TaxID=574789 RepID=A0A6A6Y2G3_9PEZI|nr:uncharacterized protein BDZ99DRAFT_512369 [Mytilinidion resinicola]KAF2802703.1 hypothetical protein BDZ99DRAFT_512369 [Mytilinidion resinicola]